MTIKDFKVGQIAYLMNFHDRQPNENTTTIDKVNVVSVGKKYVKVKYPRANCNKTFYQRDEKDSYLVEKTTCGTANHLFQSQIAIDEFKERKELVQWIFNKIYCIKANQYNIEQFREIKRILENPKT